jgi:hypothetical protein
VLETDITTEVVPWMIVGQTGTRDSDMFSVRRIVAFLLVLSFMPPVAPIEAKDPEGEYVQVKPLVGFSSTPIRKYLTTMERQVLAEVEQRIRALPDKQIGRDALAVWHVEPSVVSSATYRLQLNVLQSLRKMLAGVDGFTANSRIDIVVARTQQFIQSVLQELDCSPDLSAFDGQILMGAALCNRRVIVTNLTGYLFLTKPEQRVTPEMERRPEPSISRTPYRFVARNTSALAHEWMHFFRRAGLSGNVAPDEPLWFSEGFAEFWADIAKVRLFGDDDALTRFHVVRLRDFYDWARKCPGPLSRYRIDRGTTCEYHLGTIAFQYLVANHGGLEQTARAFRLDGRITSFAQGFQVLFGLSLEEFEAQADVYIETIRAAELTK